MARSKKPVISARKQPRQVRSEQLVAAILEAASRVLVRDGAHRFTAARVAETAGISVGSLYQYFPNKEAILFRLQAEEWDQTMDRLGRILGDASVPPPARLKAAVQTFFRSECEEAIFRGALEDAAPLYQEEPEARSHAEEGRQLMQDFIKDALPGAPASQRAFAADLIGTVMSSVGKAVSSQNRSIAEVDALATAIGDMFCAYLERAAPGRGMHQRARQ
ncbi:MAG TPA: TetR family transcriptional regulator [Dyella sp.]|uniref:TetR family transcriptional regulator n=1 Tax=Dyella sp. TaxID=1869338 RepID=UPI002CD72FA0|nr:TetR family transcriptional regulator [Dyella sp.]HUB89959.1 TetR family transcriptional regulator [Dyella sp.]